MTDLMKRYESETGKQSAIVRFMAGGQALEQKSYPKLGPYDYSMDYIAWLEAKATAYDRVMSGGKKTLKEWANLTGQVFVITSTDACFISSSVPHIGYCDGLDTWDFDGEGRINRFPRYLIDFTGDWKDSLTLPDGWGEK
jgi:hypothetical protein